MQSDAICRIDPFNVPNWRGFRGAAGVARSVATGWLSRVSTTSSPGVQRGSPEEATTPAPSAQSTRGGWTRWAPDSVFTVVDVHNDVVAYERLLLPFGEQNVVKQMIASIKSISIEGRFVNTDLMRSKDHDPQYSLRAVVDQRAPDIVKSNWADDVVEI